MPTQVCAIASAKTHPSTTVRESRRMALARARLLAMNFSRSWMRSLTTAHSRRKDKLDVATCKALSKHIPNKKPPNPWPPLPGGNRKPGRSGARSRDIVVKQAASANYRY